MGSVWREAECHFSHSATTPTQPSSQPNPIDHPRHPTGHRVLPAIANRPCAGRRAALDGAAVVVLAGGAGPFGFGAVETTTARPWRVWPYANEAPSASAAFTFQEPQLIGHENSFPVLVKLLVEALMDEPFEFLPVGIQECGNTVRPLPVGEQHLLPLPL